MTADCRLAERVFEFADEALRPAPGVLARARGHLVVCAPCAERFGADARLAAALRDVPPAAPPPFVLRRRRRARWPLVAGAAAAAALVAAALFPRFGGRPAPAPPPPAFTLPPGTTFTLTVSTITFDRGRRSVVEETTRYAADSAVPPESPNP